MNIRKVAGQPPMVSLEGVGSWGSNAYRMAGESEVYWALPHEVTDMTSKDLREFKQGFEASANGRVSDRYRNAVIQDLDMWIHFLENHND